jgi:AraC-like DNA-binding protein
VRNETALAQRRLYDLSRALVARDYRRRLTLTALARALCSSPRQIQRAYARFGGVTFAEDLRSRRLAAAAELLFDQPALAVADVARLVGYRQSAHFARAFRTRFGVSPATFRARARAYRASSAATDRRSASENGADGGRRRSERSGRGGARATTAFS